MLAPGTILQGCYRIIQPLNKGGFGQVYQAHHNKLDCIVAIKERLVDSEQQRHAFEREAKLLANLSYPVLPKVTDYFFEGQGQYFVMEFIEGDDLATLQEVRKHSFTVAEVLPWADELLKALEYLHNRHEPIIHRDIKPANIKLARDGRIYLLDFGFAKGTAGQMPTVVDGQTSASLPGLTHRYSPLEQLQHTGTTTQSDLYSLGATLFHLLAGTPPLSPCCARTPSYRGTAICPSALTRSTRLFQSRSPRSFQGS